MATPAPNSVAALAANAFGGDRDHAPVSCLDDPNFATICSFIEKFGEVVKIGQLPFDELQQMLENNADVPLPLVQLHITLLRRVFKTVTPDKWEKSLAKFGHTYCSQDAWEIERFGYKKAKIQTKLRLLKNLLEAQFDYNVKFKSEVNKLQAADLRLTPLGRDTEGQLYWYQVDADANLRVYREDIDDETWEMVASSKDELVDLISQLQRGEVKKPEPEEAIIVPEEDSNGKDIEPKEIILDTGKVEEDDSMAEESEESDEDSDETDVKPEVKTVEPLVIKQTSTGSECMKKSDQVKALELDNVPLVKQEEIHQNVTCENMGKGNIGLKLVFGVKSKPKIETPVQKQELSDSIEASLTQPAAQLSPIKQVKSKDELCKTSEVIKTEVETFKRDLTPQNLEVNKPDVKLENVVIVKNNEGNKNADISLSSDISSISKTIHKKSSKEESKLQSKLQTNLTSHTNKTPNKDKVRAIVSELVNKAKKIEPVVRPKKDTKTEVPKATLSVESPAESIQFPETGVTAVQLSQTQNVHVKRESENDKPIVSKIYEQKPQLNVFNKSEVKVTDTEAKVHQIIPEVKAETMSGLDLSISSLASDPHRLVPCQVDVSTAQPDHSADSVPMEVETSTDSTNTLVGPVEPPMPYKVMNPKEIEVLRNLKSSSSEGEAKAVVTSPTFVVETSKKDLSISSIDCPTSLANETNSIVIAEARKDVKKRVHDVVPSKVMDVGPDLASVEARNFISSVVPQNNVTSCGDSTGSSNISGIRDDHSVSKSSSVEVTVGKENVVDSKATEELNLSREPGESVTSSKSTDLKLSSKAPEELNLSSEAKEIVTTSKSTDMKLSSKATEELNLSSDAKEIVTTSKSTDMKLSSKATEELNLSSDAKEIVTSSKSTDLKLSSKATEELNLCSEAKEIVTTSKSTDLKLSSKATEELNLSSEAKEMVTSNKSTEELNLSKKSTEELNLSSEAKKNVTSSKATEDLKLSSEAKKNVTSSKDTEDLKLSSEAKKNVTSSKATEDLKFSSEAKKIVTSSKSTEDLKLSSKATEDLKLSSKATEDLKLSSKATEDLKLSSEAKKIVTSSKSTEDLKLCSKATEDLKLSSKATEELSLSSKSTKDFKLSSKSTEDLKLFNRVTASSKDTDLPSASKVNITSSSSSNTPVMEEQLTKSEAWVCGDKEVHPVDEKVTKVTTWVCGTTTTVSTVVENKAIVPPIAEPTEEHARCETEVVSEDTHAILSKSSLVIYSESSEGSDAGNDEAFTPSKKVVQFELAKDSNDGSTKEISKTKLEHTKSKQDLTPSAMKHLDVQETNVVTKKPKLEELSVKKGNTSGNEKSVSHSSAINDLKEGSTITMLNEHVNSDLNSGKCAESDSLVQQNLNTHTTVVVSANDDCKTVEKIDSKCIRVASSEGSIATHHNVEHTDKATPKLEPSMTPQSLSKEVIHSETEVQLASAGTAVLPPSISASACNELNRTENSGKRKQDEDLESLSKAPRLDIKDSPIITSSPRTVPFNPIVGETIEEEVMTIIGEGSGATNEGSNENSPASLVADIAGSNDDSDESEESRGAFPSRGRGGRRGRGRRGRPAGVGGRRGSQSTKTPRSVNRGLREVARLGVSLDTIEANGDRENERPVRASRRIAQIRLKEEEERRKLEEERLAQLKQAQMQKKAKQDATKDHTKESIGSQKSAVPKIKKGNGRKPLKDQLKFHGKDYVPSGTESEDNSEEGDASDDYDGTAKVGKRRKRRKNGKAPKKGGNPWATSSDEEDEEAVEEEEEYHYEEEEEELVFKSDHEFSPESDLGEDDGVGPSRHARTAKQDKGDKLFEEGNCCKCGKGDHPEWILLCDKCDKGWHASCLRPQLWVIPEGEWFCPPCQHNMLIENLSTNLIEYEVLLKKRENEILRKQRLAYVGISLDNVLPDKEEKQEKVESVEAENHTHDRDRHRKQRRRILSDDEDELSDDFINDRSDDNLSRSRSNSSDSEDGPVYRLRARRSKKAFNFKEYDDMINSALRGDEDEEVDEEKGEEVEEVDDEETQANGEEEEEATSGGKNDAFLKHLEKQAHEEEETDEELLDEKERLRRKELKKSCPRKTKRRINDLDAYSEEDSDDDFQASEAEDDEEEEQGEDGESEWSGDKMEEDSDDSIAKRARRKERHGRLGRREKYSDKGLVRRSTRKRKSRVSYDESDEEDDEEDQNDKWQSDESDESESNSESDDSTWGKRKKKAPVAPKSKIPNFLLESSSNSNKGKGKGGAKRKKRKADDDDVDKAWNSARGRKQKDEPIERRTRGRKINFKDILDSGESDDDGNVRPKRRPLSDSEDSRSPSSSRKLAEEIRAENARQAKEYEERQAKMVDGTVEESEVSTVIAPTVSSDSLVTVPKLLESNIQNNSAPSPKLAPSPSQLPVVPSVSPIGSPMVSSPAPLPPSSSPLLTAQISSPLPIIPASSPIEVPTISSPVPKLSVSNLSSISSPVPFVPTTQSIPPPPPVVLPKSPPPLSFPATVGALNLLVSPPPKPVIPITQPVPVPPPVSERKSKSKGSRGSRGSSKSDKQPIISDLELALTKPVKAPPLPPSLVKSLSKKRDSASINVPNANLLLAGGVLPEILSQGMGIPSQLRSGIPTPAPTSSGSSSKKGSNANSALNQPHGKTSNSSSTRPSNSSQQTPPPPISQNLSPSMPIDIDRVPNPALFQGNPGIRPFHPMWVRNPGPPTPAYTTAGSPVLGKPPPLNTSPFTGQQGPPPRPGYPSPPPLRIPNPNTSPLQAFQHFKRDSPIGGPLYRLSTGQPQPGVPLPNILPPGMMSPHSGGPERFFSAPSPYGHPYGILPPHSQGQHPQPIFGSPYDYRPPEPPFKDEPAPPPRNSSASLPTPVSSASSSPPPTSSTVPSTTKDEASATRDSEFGGLVSYFSSQRSEEDMDT